MKQKKTLKCSIVILTFAFSLFGQNTNPNETFLMATGLENKGTNEKVASNSDSFTIEKGIIENVPQKYQKRYNRWKTAFLTTKPGKALWDKYNHYPGFTLKITVADRGRAKNNGAEIGNYTFDMKGNFRGATIILGNNLGKGVGMFDDVYPILSILRTESIFFYEETVSSMARIIAVIAHEFGHLEDFTSQGQTFYQMQMFLKARKNRVQELQEAGLPLHQAVVNWSVKKIEVQFQSLFGATMEDVGIENEHRAEKTAKEVLKDFYGKKMPRFVQMAVKNYEKKYPN